MNINDRFHVNAIIEEITSTSDAFFRAASARELIDLIPVHKQPRLTIGFLKSSSNTSNEGYSPGIGNVSFDEGKETTEYNWNGIPVERVGGYKLEHTPGRLGISLMWADTQEDSSGYRCLLRYEPSTKQPTALDVSGCQIYYLPLTRRPLFSLTTWLPWKTPVNE